MPPSGYSVQQAQHVSEFLRSCARALAVEAQELKRSHVAALEHEISSIRRHVSDATTTKVQRGVLELTKAFYEQVLLSSPMSINAYWAAVDAAIENVRSDVLKIKVESELNAA